MSGTESFIPPLTCFAKSKTLVISPRHLLSPLTERRSEHTAKENGHILPISSMRGSKTMGLGEGCGF